MKSADAGKFLLAVAKRCCTPQDLEIVAVPIIADLQFETRAHAHRWLLVRWWVRVRGCLAFAKAVSLAIAVHHLKNPPEFRPLPLLRIIVAVPVALMVTVAVQVGLSVSLGYVLYSVAGLTWGRGGEFGGWLVKLLATPFMASAFFWSMYLMVPRSRRAIAAPVGLILVVLWGGLLLYGSLVPWPRMQGWLFAMGLAGWFGGVCSYWMVRRGTALR